MGKEAVHNARARGGGGEEEEEAKMRRRRTAMSVTDPCKLQSPLWQNYFRKVLISPQMAKISPPPPASVLLTLQ